MRGSLTPDALSRVERGEPGAQHTRRRFLGGAAAAGGLGVAATLADAEVAAAAELQGYFDVVADYGAHNDGTDPAGTRTAIQNAINAAGQTPGGTVYFPPGVYAVDRDPVNTSQCLVLPSNTRMVGHGAKSIIRAAGGFTSRGIPNVKFMIQSSGASDILISDLTVDADHQVQQNVIKVGAGQRVYIRNVEVVNHDWVNPNLDRPAPPANEVNTAAGSISVGGVAGGAIEGCYVHKGSRDGIDVINCTDFIVRDTIVEDVGDDHIAFYGSQGTVIGNFCNARNTRRGAAIVVTGAGSVVTGNICYGGIHGGIEVRGNVDNPALPTVQQDRGEMLISDNLLVEAGNSTADGPVPPMWDPHPSWGGSNGSAICVLIQNGSFKRDVHRLNITGNIIYAPRNHGITFALAGPNDETNRFGRVSDVLISGNTIWRGAPAVLHQDQTTDGCGIACIANQGDATDIRISDNDIRDAPGGGIKVANTTAGVASKRWDVLDNRIMNAGSAPAISLTKVTDVTVKGNRADNQQYGFQATDPAGTLVIAANTFTANAGSNAPIALAGSTSGLQKVRVRDNPGFSPWSGVLTTSGGWTAFQPPGTTGVTWHYKEVTLPSPGFTIPFGNPPQVILTTDTEDYAAAVTSVSTTNFTGRVWIATPTGLTPSTSLNVTVYWVAESVD